MGDGEDNHAYSTCCRLIELYSFTDDGILDILQDWNSRCVPPWNEKKLRRKISQARKNVGSSDNDPKDAEDDFDGWPTLAAEAYYRLAGEIVKRIEPHTRADSVALLLATVLRVLYLSM
jgi:hypothetical protein